MADGLVLTRRLSERGVHETAQRAAWGATAGVVTQYVGYEEWAEPGFVRREMARYGVALILGFGDTVEVFDGEVGSPVRTLGAFVVGNQSRSSVTGVGGHQLGVQVELSPAGALGLFGDVEALNDAVVPLDEALGRRGARLTERLAEAADWAARLHLLDEALGDDASTTALSPAVDWLRRALCAAAGRARIEPLLDATGWSRRHVTAQFKRQLGISPKAYAASSPLRARGFPAHDGGRGTDAGRRRHRVGVLRPVAPHPGLRGARRDHAGRLRGRPGAGAGGQVCPRRGGVALRIVEA